MPLCLGCWRQRFGLYEPLPAPPKDWPDETCEVCGHPTNHGLYLLRGEHPERESRRHTGLGGMSLPD